MNGKKKTFTVHRRQQLHLWRHGQMFSEDDGGLRVDEQMKVKTSTTSTEKKESDPHIHTAGVLPSARVCV